MSLRVREPGLFSLLVARGRPGTRSLGVPVGGPADAEAMALGNGLVGNSVDAPALEVTMAGPTLEALRPVAAVVFGAAFRVAINGNPIAAGTTFTLEPGDVFKIGPTPSRLRGYLCVAGGFEGATVLGSRSALAPLRGGEDLNCPSSRTFPRALPFIECEPPVAGAAGPTLLRVVPGPQYEWFTDPASLSQEFEVAAASDRMGVRLKGAPLARRPGELVSEPVAPGAVQVTNDGLPVVLGVDGQTIGGYPKIAHVIRADLDCLGRLRPQGRVRFVSVTWEEAEAAAHARAAVLAGWLARLRAADRRPEML